jgi:hypothetical protein
VKVAQFIRDIQEMYNQWVIFYRTGKLAYVTSKWWEQYDSKYEIGKKLDEMKRLTTERASSLGAFSSNNKAAEGMSKSL